jgi:hypothetical protein
MARQGRLLMRFGRGPVLGQIKGETVYRLAEAPEGFRTLGLAFFFPIGLCG